MDKSNITDNNVAGVANSYPSDHNPKQYNKIGKDVSDILSMEDKFPT